MREQMWGILMILPLIAIFAWVRVLPALSSFAFSFTEYNLFASPTWAGLANFRRALGDDALHRAILVTFGYAAGTTIPSIVLALPLALALNKRFKGSRFLRLVLYLPQVLSPVAIGMIWVTLLNPVYGPVNALLSTLGIGRVGWLSDPNLALYTLMAIGVWTTLGYNVVIYLAGLQSISRDLVEAAWLDGAGPLQMFFHMTLPLLAPTTTFLVVTNSIFALQGFDLVSIMTGGGPAERTTTVVLYIYRQAFSQYDMGYASAVALILFLLIVSVAGAFSYWSRRNGRGEI
jgi:ABC-type sugar transport system permease subunit